MHRKRVLRCGRRHGLSFVDSSDMRVWSKVAPGFAVTSAWKEEGLGTQELFVHVGSNWKRTADGRHGKVTVR